MYKCRPSVRATGWNEQNLPVPSTTVLFPMSLELQGPWACVFLLWLNYTLNNQTWENHSFQQTHLQCERGGQLGERRPGRLSRWMEAARLTGGSGIFMRNQWCTARGDGDPRGVAGMNLSKPGTRWNPEILICRRTSDVTEVMHTEWTAAQQEEKKISAFS